MADTKIEWATKAWNPVTGCVPHSVHPGCRNCYARRMSNRLAGRFGYPADDPFRVTFHPDRLDAPKKWFRERVFVNSMGDLFAAPWEWIDAVFSVMYHDRGENTFIILTKQPDVAARYVAGMWDRDNAPMPRGDYRRIILGTSISDQATADELIPEILKIERFTLAVSIEPMLGPVDLTNLTHHYDVDDKPTGMALSFDGDVGAKLDWVICGGESGPGARPMHPDWARSLRDQCVSAGVPFFFKSFGQYYPGGSGKCAGVWHEGRFLRGWGSIEEGRGENMFPCGPKWKDAQLLDGVEWKQFPEVSR